MLACSVREASPHEVLDALRLRCRGSEARNATIKVHRNPNGPLATAESTLS